MINPSINTEIKLPKQLFFVLIRNIITQYYYKNLEKLETAN